MKLINKLLLIPVLGTLLIGCQNKPVTPEEPEQTYDENGNPNAFSKTLSKIMKDAFGQEIPFCPCVSYEYENSIDPYGDTEIDVYFYFNAEETLDKAYNYYAYLCEQDEWIVESGTIEGYDCVYADKMQITGKNDGVELCFLPSMKNEKYCLGVFGIQFLYEDENVYPQVAVDRLVGEEYGDYFPQAAQEGAKYKFYFSYEEMSEGKTYFNLRLYVYNAYYTLEEEFFNGLLDNGFFIWNDLDIDDDEALPYLEYPGYEGGAYDAYFFGPKGEFMFGCYFTFSSLYNAMLVDFFIIK